MKKVLVALNLNEQQKQRFLDIRDAFPGGLEFVFFGEEEPTHRDLYGIDAAVGWLTTESVEGHDLDYIQIGYTGIAHFCRPGILQQKTLLANCPGIFGPAVCELMVTHTLNLLKRPGGSSPSRAVMNGSSMKISVRCTDPLSSSSEWETSGPDTLP